MNCYKINKIFFKELKDTFRDRSTILTVFIIPLLLYPLLFIVSGFLLQSVELEERTLVPKVGLINIEKKSNIYEQLHSSGKTIIVDEDSLREKLESGKLLALVEAENDLSEELLSEKPVKLNLLYDEANRLSIRAKDILSKFITDYEKDITAERLTKRNLDTNLVNVFSVNYQSITSSKKMSGFIVGILVPYLLIILLYSSSMNTASDITAGEKERKTIETLLVSNISREEIVFGKLLSVTAVGLASAVMGLIGLAITLQSSFSLLASMSDLNLSLSFGSLFFVFLMLIPVSQLFSSLLLMIGTYAKTVKESTSYSTYVMIFVVLLAMVSVIRRGAEPSTENFFIPVINTTLTQQELLMNVISWEHIIITILTTAVLAAAATFITIKFFLDEKILFRN